VTLAPYLNPFVLSTSPTAVAHHDRIDLYLPEDQGPHPAVVFVHGGPLPADLEPTPRDWPVFVGYGSAVAARGAIGVMLDHRLHDPDAFAVAADDVAAAVDRVRRDPRVDGDRVALWFFSGGGPLMSDWLSKPPGWLRCLAATYPVLAPPPEAPDDFPFRPIEAVTGVGGVPIVLTRVGRERPAIASTVDSFVDAARASGARLDIIDVPNGQHGFDHLDHDDESRTAVERALGAVLAAL
jgi:acetyl esterase/lipase